jgi:hypothetical protein
MSHTTIQARDHAYHSLTRRFGIKLAPASTLTNEDRKRWAARSGTFVYDDSSPETALRDLAAKLLATDPSLDGDEFHEAIFAAAAACGHPVQRGPTQGNGGSWWYRGNRVAPPEGK